jgi:hypothetical protein
MLPGNVTTVGPVGGARPQLEINARPTNHAGAASGRIRLKERDATPAG